MECHDCFISVASRYPGRNARGNHPSYERDWRRAGKSNQPDCGVYWLLPQQYSDFQRLSKVLACFLEAGRMYRTSQIATEIQNDSLADSISGRICAYAGYHGRCRLTLRWPKWLAPSTKRYKSSDRCGWPPWVRLCPSVPAECPTQITMPSIILNPRYTDHHVGIMQRRMKCRCFRLDPVHVCILNLLLYHSLSILL